MIKEEKQLNKKSQKSPTAPYLSITKLEEVIELVSNRTYGEFTPAIFKNRGFSNADALLAMNTLKFLNLITNDGKPTEQIAKIGLKGDARKEAFKEIIKKAYKKLFDVVPAPQNLPSDEIFNEMKTQYEISSRIARQAVPVFLKIAEFAGLKKEGSIVGRKRIPKTGEATKTRKIEKQLEYNIAINSGFNPIRVAEGRMILNIPSELQNKILEGDDEILYQDWRNLMAEIKKFADKYIPDKHPEKETPPENTEGV